jgi:hypothetical protein
MNKMDNRFQIIINQNRGHWIKYFKEVTRQPYRENFFTKKIVNIWNLFPYFRTALKQTSTTGCAVSGNIILEIILK